MKHARDGETCTLLQDVTMPKVSSCSYFKYDLAIFAVQLLASVWGSIAQFKAIWPRRWLGGLGWGAASSPRAASAQVMRDMTFTPLAARD